jgi:arginase family enzyme
MDLAPYFQPVELEDFTEDYLSGLQTVGAFASVYDAAFPHWGDADLVLFGCQEDRGGTGRRGSSEAPDLIRAYFYQLAAHGPQLNIADLGNLKPTPDLNRYYNYLETVTGILLHHGKKVLMIGGTQDLSWAQYRAFETLETRIEYVSVDSSPDILQPADEETVDHHSHNYRVLTHQPDYLADFTVIGTQKHFIAPAERDALDNLHFQRLNLGDLNQDISAAEPYLRQVHLLSIDCSAVRQADAPGTNHGSPAGLTAEQLCQLARFAGMGYHGDVMNICEVNPEQDVRSMTTNLAALVLWYYIEGYYNRPNDRPDPDRRNLTKYIARLQGPVPQIVFFKNEATGRWWMEVPGPEVRGQDPGRRVLVPCSQRDYRIAQADEVPARWWSVQYRLSDTLPPRR